MKQIIRNHFKKYLRRKPWDFCWRIAIEGLIVSYIAAIITEIFGAPEREFPEWSMFTMFIFVVLIAPPMETLIMQAFPIFIARIFKSTFKTQVLAGTIVFSLFHIPEGIAAFIAAGIFGGFYFSFTYARWRRKSRWTAFWVTALSHAIHNGIAFIMILIYVLSQ